MMKLIPSIPVLVLLTAAPAARAFDFIRQTQLIDGVPLTTDIPVTQDSGEVISNQLVADFSIFQLWATYEPDDGTVELLKLDEKSVGTFLPEVTIGLQSEDPYQPTSTRADRPYAVTVNIQGMLSGEEYPDYAKSVVVQKSYELYAPDAFTPTGVSGTQGATQALTGNGSVTYPAVIQTLPVDDPTQAAGVETFSASVLPELGMDEARLASASVIVFPVAGATIHGLEDGKRYKLGIPGDPSVSVKNLYPRSITYAQIYPGPAALGTDGTLVPGSMRRYGEAQGTPNRPQQTIISLDNLTELMPEDGQYTVEVLTLTPFNNGNPERLRNVSFWIDRSLSVNGQVTTSEAGS